MGVSSYQLNDASRGFSFQGDGPLDMRMSLQSPLKAYDLVNRWSENELSRCFFEYGEVRKSRLLARVMVRERQKKPIATTSELARLVYRLIGRNSRSSHHPATQVFQALRIAVNDELGALREGITQAVAALSPGGRISVISFHSLEDRLVKRFFKVSAEQHLLKIITKKPLFCSEEEKRVNPRARSAKLRVAEKL